MRSRQELTATIATALAVLAIAGCGTSAHHAVDHPAHPVYDALCFERPSLPPGASESLHCTKRVDLRPLLGMSMADGERWARPRGYGLLRVEPLRSNEMLEQDYVPWRIDVAVYSGVITRIKYFG